jgi:Ca-activated chloride channel family protein
LADTQTIADPVAGLIDIPLPPEISLWPTTWLARIVIVVLFLAVTTGTWQFLRHRRANRYRREALAELKQIVAMAPQQIASQLSLLVRRTALAAFPREQVASLTGEAWLAFLDRSLDGTEFSAGPGRLLASAPYSPLPPGERQLAGLVALTRRWIRRHHV